MAQQWFVQRPTGLKEGPFSFRDLKALANRGELRPEELVWNETLTDWIPAAKVDGLFDEATTIGSGFFYGTEASELAKTVPSPRGLPEEDYSVREPDDNDTARKGDYPAESPEVARGQGSFSLGQPSRKVSTFEGSPTAFARSRETLGRHALDFWLAFVRTLCSSGFLQATQHLFLLCGRYGLLSGIFLVLGYAVLFLRPLNVSIALLTLAMTLYLFISHYLSARLIFVLQRWDHRTRAQLVSSVIPDGLSLFIMLVTLLAIILGTVYALATGFVDLIFYTVALFIWGFFTSIQILDLDGLRININQDLSPIEEVAGLLQLASKMIARLCPVVFGALALLGNLHLILAILLTLSANAPGGLQMLHSVSHPDESALVFDSPGVAGWDVGRSGLLMLVGASFWPVVSYFGYLIAQLVIALLLPAVASYQQEIRNLSQTGEIRKRELTDA